MFDGEMVKRNFPFEKKLVLENFGPRQNGLRKLLVQEKKGLKIFPLNRKIELRRFSKF